MVARATASHGPQGPKLREVELGHLTEADAYDIDEDTTLEGLRWADASFGDRALRGVAFVGCEFVNVALGDADLTAARFGESRLTRLNVPVLQTPDASWVGAEITASRIGAWEAYGANLRATRLTECKVTYANLRGATLTDVLLTGCTFDELDLMDVKGARVSFVDCTIGVLTAHRTQISDLDLRGASIGAVSGMDGLKGATMSDTQVALLAPQFADHLGIVVQ
ncbi:pentapeptide repeat-containing protein [Demequina aurantiaca]|uniref:pentapeptide repeat-containing protein n=1 Tax=Demequina aurantiaca TaxID=676200 RepID=UPI0007835031|nr:pentapeptide repeat-containing protein [Demequina aurantiaca]